MTAQDGVEVQLAMARGLEVDVILTDIQMQDMHGDLLCTRLRAAGMRLPIVAVTGATGRGPNLGLLLSTPMSSSGSDVHCKTGIARAVMSKVALLK